MWIGYQSNVSLLLPTEGEFRFNVRRLSRRPAT